MTTNNERLAILETRVASLEDKVDNIDKKLDDLLELKNKGLGAFWLVSLIAGSGLVSLLWSVINYVRGS